MAKDHSDGRERSETIRGGTFKQSGYNADIDMPVDIEPVPKDAAGAALDVRKDLPGDGVVEVHDDDEDILDREKTSPISK